MRLPFTSAEPLGEELIGDSKFANNGWWGLDSNWDILEGKAVSNGSSGTIYKGNVLNVQKTYLATITLSAYTSGTLTYPNIIGGGQDIPNNINTPFTFKFIPSSKTTSLTSLSFNGSVSSFSVEEYAQETPDISGNDNNAILKTGKALVFDGSNDGVDISNFSMSGSEGTFAFWYKPQTATDLRYVIDLAESGDGRFIIGNQNNKFKVFTQTGGTGGNWTISDDYVVSLNEWQRVVVTIDSSKNLKIYKNGVQLGSTQTSVTNLNIDNVSAAYIGQGHGGTGANVIDGSLSDFQIYNKVWSESDVTYDYKNPQNLVTDNLSTDIHLGNLKAWWHLSEGSGSVIHDSAPLLGVEEITNGNFESDSDWAVIDGGWTISNNEACHTGSASFIEQNTNLISGRTYKVVWTISSHTNQSAGISSNSGARSGDFAKSAEGTYLAYLVSNGNNFRFFSTGDNCIGNVSIKEVYNIDGDSYDDDTNVDGTLLGADWEHSQERIPQLGMMNWSKGSNVLTYSEDFSEWNVVNATLTGNQLDANGQSNAYIIEDDNSGAFERVDNTISSTSNTHTFSVFIKKKTSPVSSYSGIQMGTGLSYVIFDSYNGTYNQSQNTNYDNIIVENYSSDWWRIKLTGNVSTSTRVGLWGAISTNGVDIQVSATGSEIFFGAQLEESLSANAYRRAEGTAVTDATLISSATDSQKDILGNAVRVKGSGFNLDGTGYAEVLDDSAFDIPGCNNVDEGAFSFMGWAKFNYTVQAASSFNVIYSNGANLTATGSFSIASENNNKISAFVSGNYITTTTTQNIGDWVHFALTRDVNGSVKLYINKTLENTISQTNAMSNTGSKKVAWDGTANDRFYNERIDDVKFYNRELSSDEIEQNYNATKSGHNN